MAVDAFMKREPRVAELIYLIGVFNLITYLLVDNSGRIDKPVFEGGNIVNRV
jgi:hypothetical protein